MGKRKLPKWKKIKKNTEIVRTWRGQGWIAQVIENEDGGGWAVTMTREGDEEPVYVAPWTMGRNKVDPKPLNLHAFNTWVKSASEFLMRSKHQIRTADRKIVDVELDDGDMIKVIFDIDRGDYQAQGVLKAIDALGEEITRLDVDARFNLTVDAAYDWVASDYAPPAAIEDTTLNQTVADDDVWDPDGDNSQDGDDDFIDEVVYEEEYVDPYEEPTFDYDEM
ncbi:MAG: hypothetical protein AAFV53_28105 [Myxococcota bacterium]